MRYATILLSLLLLSSCGAEIKTNRDPRPTDNWKVIDKAVLNMKMATGNLYVVDTANIVYTSTVANQFTVDFSSVSLTESTDGMTIDLGSMSITRLRVNNLNQCGTGTQKCTAAIVRVYTTELTGYAGISGFVNKDNSYGVPFYAGEGTATEAVGLTSTNAAIVDSHTILANDNKLTLSDMSGTTYELEVDFSNGGAGSYEMQVTVELAVGI